MTRRPQTVDDLDEYQRTVLAGMIARREFEVGYRLSKLQRAAVLKAYLAQLGDAPTTRRVRTSRPTLPPMEDYHWHPPTPARRLRGR